MARQLSWLVLAVLVLFPGRASSQECITGTVTAEETSPGSGLWRYRTTLTYDVSHVDYAPSHFNVLLGTLSSCACACSAGMFTFDLVAGTSPGTDRLTGLPGTVEYLGNTDCSGDPTLPDFPRFSIKWEPPAGSTVEPDLAGIALFSFLSPFPPGPITSATSAVKFGGLTCGGSVTGTLPVCDCVTGIAPGSWGRLKVMYR